MEFLELFINEIVNSGCSYGYLNTGLLLKCKYVCVLSSMLIEFSMLFMTFPLLSLLIFRCATRFIKDHSYKFLYFLFIIIITYSFITYST